MKFTRQQWQWIFYDWANSGYGILVVTAVLPVYFKAVTDHAGVSAANSTALWGYANSFGTLIISLLAPLLGALADYPHAKKRAKSLYLVRNFADNWPCSCSNQILAGAFTCLYWVDHWLLRRKFIL